MTAGYLSRNSWITLTIVLSVSAALGWVVYWSAHEYENERAAALFERDLLDHANAVVRVLDTKAEVLHALRGLFENSDEVTREEFRSIATDAIARHPAIHALEWSPRVPDDRRTEHEAQARRDGLERYRITESPRHGEIVTAGRRAEYFPVYYVVPQDGNEPAIGYDLASESRRKSSLERALETGRLTLTEPIDLVQTSGVDDGVLALLPVLERDAESTGSRRDGLAGYVLAVFCFDAIVTESLNYAGGPQSYRFQLLDADVHGQASILYASAGPGLDLSQHRVHRQPIEYGGQEWMLTGEMTPDYLEALRTYQPVALGIGVFLITPLLVGFLLARSERAHGAALNRNVQILRSILGSLNVGVIVANRAGRFILANDAAREVVGTAPRYVPPADWARRFGLHLPDGKTLYPADQLPLARAIRGFSTSEAEIVVRNAAMPQGRWLCVNGSPLVDEKGSVRGGVVIFRDITSRKETEEHLLRLSNAVEQTADSVFITDINGTIEYANPAFRSVTGFDPLEITGATPSILNSGRQGPRFYENMWKTILAGRVFRAPIVNRKKNGELFDAEITISPIWDSSGNLTHFVSVMKDMTERKRIQEQDFEMRIASSVQLRLYPQESPQVAQFDIDGIVVPADATCGDYFDYVRMPGSTLGLVIGDVSGHGFGPALVMAETRSYIRMVTQSIEEPSEILSRTNELLSQDLEDHRYVTLLFARLDLATGRLVYANAGHTSAHVLEPTGKIRQVLEPTGPPLGLFGSAPYASGPEIRLEPGELLVFLTDGVTEAENSDGEQFGIERALDVVAIYREESSREIADRVQRAVRAFTGSTSLRDDLTIVLCKRDPVA